MRSILLAARALRRSPLFTLAAVVCLALGIGANTALFGVLDTLFFRPPAGVANPDEVVRINVGHHLKNAPGMTFFGASQANWKALADSSRAFAAVAGYDVRSRPVGRGREARERMMASVTPNYFSALGVRAAVGRFFTDEETGLPGAPQAVVISHGLWRSVFGADSAAVGRQIVVGGHRLTIVGVAQPRFAGVEREPVELWLPLLAAVTVDGVQERQLSEPSNTFLRLVGRLRRDGGGAPAALAEAKTVLSHGADDGFQDPKADVTVTGLTGTSGPGSRYGDGVARWLAAVSAIVLLIACANVANLQLARATSRRRELALRMALGASRRRLMGDLLVESMLLAALGGVAALVTAVWSGTAATLFEIPAPAALEARTLAFTLALCVATGLLCGIMPALQVTRRGLEGELRQGGGGVASHRSMLRDGLLVAQVALSLVLVTGAALFVRSLRHARALDLGIAVDNVAVVTANLTAQGMGDTAATAYLAQMRDRVAALPGVRDVALSSFAPFQGMMFEQFEVPGHPAPASANSMTSTNQADPRYFAALGIPVRSGRVFTQADAKVGAPPVTIVNEAMAKAYWPDGDALGGCIKIGMTQYARCHAVVGIVGDVREALQRPPEPLYFTPFGYQGLGAANGTLIVRTEGRASTFVPTLRAAVTSLAADGPFVDVKAMSDIAAERWRTQRVGATMFSIYGGLALLLAAVGLYGVMAYTVAQRRREMGVRLALGATGGRVARAAVGRAAALTIGGLALGVAGSLLATRMLRAYLYGVEPADPLSLSMAILVLVCIALLAAWLPARRAASTDPMIALRAE